MRAQQVLGFHHISVLWFFSDFQNLVELGEKFYSAATRKEMCELETTRNISRSKEHNDMVI